MKYIKLTFKQGNRSCYGQCKLPIKTSEQVRARNPSDRCLLSLANSLSLSLYINASIRLSQFRSCRHWRCRRWMVIALRATPFSGSTSVAGSLSSGHCKWWCLFVQRIVSVCFAIGKHPPWTTAAACRCFSLDDRPQYRCFSTVETPGL